MIFENIAFHLSDKYLFLNWSLSTELSEKQESSKIPSWKGGVENNKVTDFPI